MENVEIFEVVKPEGETVTYVKIDRGNGEFTSMTKAHYEAMQAEQSTPMVSEE